MCCCLYLQQTLRSLHNSYFDLATLLQLYCWLCVCTQTGDSDLQASRHQCVSQSGVLTLMCMQQRTSHCYRIAYRSMERSLTDEEINGLQEQTRKALAEEMHVELR